MMKLRAIIIAGFLGFVLTVAISAQGEPEWQRVRSDEGHFSIEVPTGARAFFDAEGFTVSSGFGNAGHLLRDVWIINAVAGSTLVSVESYNASDSALDRIYEQDKQRNGVEATKKGKANGIEVKEIRLRGTEFFALRKYFRIGNAIYILTAAARTDSPPEWERFFASVKLLAAGASDQGIIAATEFKSLPRLDVAIETGGSFPKSQTDPKQESGVTKLAIVHKPFPSYTPSARENRFSGRIVLRVTFGIGGHLEKVSVVQANDLGMLRQTFFSALRIKFLPKLRNGNPEVSSTPIEYTFTIS
jgi:hypothetical protein